MNNPKLSITNNLVSLSVNGRGGIVSFYNRLTRTELITFPEKAEAWRLVIPTGRHTLGLLWGSEQKLKKIEIHRDEFRQGLMFVYESIRMGKETLPIKAAFTLSLENNSNKILASVKLENSSPYSIDEVEFPILRGLGGFPARNGRRLINLVVSRDRGNFYEDIINKGLPETGAASNHYAREQETAMFDSQAFTDKRGRVISPAYCWLDLWCREQGLYFGHEPVRKDRLVFKLERFPKGTPNGLVHTYPPGTPLYVSVFGIHVPCLASGKSWRSEPVTIMPHKGDWHAGADQYSAYRHKSLPAFCDPPAWTRNFVGWTEIVGKLYTGEVFHNYRRCAEQVVKDKQVTGIDFVFYYGHSKLGAEGADFDQLPATDLGGEKDFRAMIRKLHRNGIRIMLLDHLHRWINKDLPEYKRLKLERYAVWDENGRPSVVRWYKETARSCMDLSGPTPEWIEMCPSCEGWRRHYLGYLTRMIELGVDGLELDLFGWYHPLSCFNPIHHHAKGESMWTAKREFMRAVREHAKRLNPDFVLIGETMVPETREVLEGWYPSRYTSEEDRIHRYLFPEIRLQAVLVGNYAYDQVNKALQLGIGVETEIWGLRKTTQEACPELAEYLGEVNRFKRCYPHLMIQGLFRDTVGARVQGKIYYSLLAASNGNRAIVLRNPANRVAPCRATFTDLQKGDAFRLWRPFQKERTLRTIPVQLQLKPYEAAVLLAMKP